MIVRTLNCFICKKELKTHDVRHIYFCATSNGLCLSRPELQLKQLSHNVGLHITKQFLEREYLDDGKSLPDFKRDYGLAYRQTQFLLKYFGIPERNSSVAALHPKTQERRKTTCLSVLGVDNASKSSAIKKKKARTFLGHYGVDNIWKTPWYRKMTHQIMMARFGKGSVSNLYGRARNGWMWKTASPERKKQIIEKITAGSRRYWNGLTEDEKVALIQSRCRRVVWYYNSKLEVRMQRILMGLGLSFCWQKWVRRKSYDFHITGTDLLVEVQGDYWHANPKIYRPGHLLDYHGLRLTAGDVWKRDEEKRKNAEKYGYRIGYLWESEMKQLSDDEISQRVIDWILAGDKP